jgi:predicted P-loop ATPase
VITFTPFAGGKDDCIPCGPPVTLPWDVFCEYLTELAAAAPVATKNQKGLAGHISTVTFLPVDDNFVARSNSDRATRGIAPHSPARHAAMLQWGYRRLVLADEVHAVVLDYDDLPTTPPDWTPDVWVGDLIAYTSGTYHPEREPGRWRVFLRLDSPMPAAEYTRFLDGLRPLLPPGALTRVATQPAYLPTRLPDVAAVEVVRVPGPPLDWRAIRDMAPLRPPRTPRADDVEPSVTQDATNDGRVVELLAQIWGSTTGHRAFGALGGIMYRKGIARERALDIAASINELAQCPHADPEGRIDEAYDEAHEMGIPKLLEALTADASIEARGKVGVVWNMVSRWLDDSVRAPVVAHIIPANAPVPAGMVRFDQGNGNVELLTQSEAISTWRGSLEVNAKGEIKNTVDNTLRTLNINPFWHGMFGYDDFTTEVVFLRDSEVPHLKAKAGDVFNEGTHVTSMQSWFGAARVNEPTPTGMIAAVQRIAEDRRFHLVRDWLQKLPLWDGVDRSLCGYVGAEPTPYHEVVCRKWLISAVARAMQPGCQVDTMLILESETQGWRKSSLLRALLPDTRWGLETSDADVGAKDFMQDLRGKWIAEIAEVDKLIGGRDASVLKSFVTRRDDTYRPSYARKARDFPRQVVFFGTTNKTDYLRDDTGNRRFWCVRCTREVNIGALKRDREQIWAQALTDYFAGHELALELDDARDAFVWWLTPEEEALARDEQADRLEQDIWTPHVKEWLQAHADRVAEGFLATDVLGGLPGAKPLADLSRADEMRMTKTLRMLGFEHRRVQVDGARCWKWFAGTR